MPSLKSRNWESKRKSSRRFLVVITVFIIALFAVFLYWFHDITTTEESNVGEGDASNNVQNIDNASQRLSQLSSLKLPNESKFSATMKDCRNIQNCKLHFPDKEYPIRQRVAFVSTGGQASDEMFKIFKKALSIYFDNDQNLMEEKIELVSTTHVPPYGYGKSHGWTKIIRVFQSSIVVETIEALQSSGENRRSGEDVLRDPGLPVALSQVIRFHCRLSHVAAHTFMFNLDLLSNNLVKDVTAAVLEIASNPKQLESVAETIRASKVEIITAYLKEALSKPLSGRPSLPRTEVNDKDLKEFEIVLQQELDSTNGLKKWPCRSFWDFNVPLSSLAERLSPNCNAPFTSCGVKRDRCEMNGDARCN